MSSSVSTGQRVIDNPARQRFELDLDGTVAFIDYTRSPGEISFDHTKVPDSMAGKGVGSRLAEGALELVRTDGLKVIPRCSFIAGFIDRHPQFATLVAAR